MYICIYIHTYIYLLSPLALPLSPAPRVSPSARPVCKLGVHKLLVSEPDVLGNSLRT